ncbi:MAG: penicillin-binding transpeptidase domain-containing protein, partial [Devosia sp.]|nr:penicillin-binding transpeptidase domain-containing protein [Devosia sp.]
REFGFGSRSGVELPGETRGLLQPVKRWGGSSIGSISIGQEVAVTPVQLVTMVSTIANGGVYLPPHILLPGQLDSSSPNQKPSTPQSPSPVRPGAELPNPLPPGAHRVIATLTAAEIRKMMEGVVLFGTGRPAQLNGYSSGGKTGTAQKIDPATHKYSKSVHIASFAGFAPVNNPVIAIAVVVDSPKGDYYGTTVSAPIFAEVAQQVLEYLGVPHDIDLRPSTAASKSAKPLVEDSTVQSEDDIKTLYDAANDLPSDDPLRAQPPAPSQSAKPTPPPTAEQASAQQTTAPPPPMKTVTIQDGARLRVPSLLGLPVRKVIEQAAAAGLQVQIVGSGTSRQQAPDPGSMVLPGTKIVVRCGK